MNSSRQIVNSTSPLSNRKKVLKNFWYCAGLSKELRKRSIKRVQMLGKDLALYRDISSDKIMCVENSCPHRGAPLSHGWIDDIQKCSSNGKSQCSSPSSTRIVCPYHGWAFDENGMIAEIPSLPNGQSLPSNQVLDVYDVEEKCGFVWLFFGARSIPMADRPPIPYIKEFDAPHGSKWTRIYGEIDIDAPYFNVFDNAIDISHIHYLHSFGNKENPIVSNIKMCDKDAFSCSGTLNIKNKPVNMLWNWTKTNIVPVNISIHLPTTSAIKIRLGNGIEMITFVNTVPIDRYKSVNRFCLLRNFAHSPLFDSFAKNAMLSILSEDKVMLESLSLNGKREISVSTDRPQLSYRNLWKSWADLGYLVDI